MINIKILKNGVFLKEVHFGEPPKVKDVIAKTNLKDYERLSFHLDYKFASTETVIKKDRTLDCIGIHSLEGMRIYQDSAIFILMKAFHYLFPDYKLVAEHSIGNGIYFEAFGGLELTEERIKKIETRMKSIVERKLRIKKLFLNPDDAEEIFEELNRPSVVFNLQNFQHIIDTIYKCGEYYDYYIRELADNTSIIKKFKLVPHTKGLLLLTPEFNKHEMPKKKKIPKKLFEVHQEYDKWLNILKAHNTPDLNKYVENNDAWRFIQIEESLQNNKIAEFAKQIHANKEAKLVLIAGPTSSGKTTFSKRLAIQLNVLGVKPIIIGMDNYFLPRTKTPKKANGEYDFESVKAMDMKLLNDDLAKILEGEKVELPEYNFIEGIPEKSGKIVELGENNVIIMEGIHAINEELTKYIPKNKKIKIYISSLNQLNIDPHNRIPTTDSRKIRRIVRDFNFRGYSAEDTLKRWHLIREGEEENIFPFQEEADLTFNSALTYEMSVFKKYAIPILMKVKKDSPVYLEAKRLILLLEHLISIDDRLVPINSLVREFIGGLIFDRE